MSSAAVHRSVFAKLLMIMVTMAACLLLLVTMFFWLAVGPLLNTTIHQMTQPAAGHSATHEPSSPVRDTATPSANDVHAAHAVALVVLLLSMVTVVLSAHAVLKRLLQPLRDLSDGVARPSAGELDVV